MIYCIGGVSGTGKSTLIANHPELERFPHIDVSDAYGRAEERGVNIPWYAAFEELLVEARELLEDGERNIVLEAFFRPHSEQRQKIQELAEKYHQAVTFVWCSAPRSVCIERVNKQQGDSPQRKAARLQFINATEDRWFQPIPDEDPDDITVLDNTGECATCLARTALVGPEYEYCEECIPSDYVYDSDDVGDW